LVTALLLVTLTSGEGASPTTFTASVRAATRSIWFTSATSPSGSTTLSEVVVWKFAISNLTEYVPAGSL
jgi:hypothetical protein